MGSEFDHKV